MHGMNSSMHLENVVKGWSGDRRWRAPHPPLQAGHQLRRRNGGPDHDDEGW